jgi:hypothetical protein
MISMRSQRLRLFLSFVLILSMLAACGKATEPETRSTDPAGRGASMQPADTRPLIDREQARRDYAQTPFKVLRIGEQEWNGAPALAVTFSVPLDPETVLERHLSVTDRRQQSVEGGWMLDASATMAIFPFVEPQNRYQVHVAKGLAAVTGRLLAEAQAQWVETAERPHMVRFAGRGAQMSPRLTDGLEIEAVNVAAVDLDLWQVRENEISAFEGVVHAESLLLDAPLAFDGYRPQNFDSRFMGPVSLSEALQRSLNVPAVQVLAELGPSRWYARLQHAGLDLQLPPHGQPNLSLALGGAGVRLEQLAALYAALARDGVAAQPRFTPDQPLHARRLMSAEAAWIIHHTLRDPLQAPGETLRPQLRLSADGRYQLPADCHVADAQTRTAQLWPPTLEPWLPDRWQRAAQLPPSDPRCRAVAATPHGRLQLHGIQAGAELSPLPGRIQLPDLTLTATGVQGEAHWFLNGTWLGQTHSASATEHRWTLAAPGPGEQRVAVMDQAGKFEQVRFRVLAP